MKKILLLMTMVLTCVGAWAQKPVLTYENITAPQELSAEDATAIRDCSTSMTIVADVDITNSSDVSVLFAAVADYTSNSTANNSVWALGTGGNSVRYIVGPRQGGWYSSTAGTLTTEVKSVVCTVSGTNIHFYVDGKFVKTQTSTKNLSTFNGENAKFYLGGLVYNTNTNWGQFNGEIKSLKIYDSVFSAGQISENFNEKYPEVVLSRAIANAETLYNGVKSNIGEGVGKYSAPDDFETQFENIVDFYNGINETTNAEDINEKINELEELVASVTLNMPEAGKFYRINNGGNYITSNVTNGKIALSTTNNGAESVYFFDGTHLLAYATGLYIGLNGTDWTFEAVGSNDISKISIIAAANDAPSKYNISSGGRWLHKDNGFVNRCSNNTCGDTHNWTIEEVDWLPIPVNVEAGKTTLYSPVELALSNGRFKAYTVSEVSGTSAILAEQSVVPANTGVVLELQEGAEVVNGCVYLQIKETETTGVESMLSGAYADEYNTDDAYVLSMVDGEVGLYIAKKNFDANNNKVENGVKWLNNGFKAYLPAQDGQSLVKAFFFDFGGETTAIETVETENANAPIYDLSGRRVVNTVKGGIYIQNGKKFIVK